MANKIDGAVAGKPRVVFTDVPTDRLAAWTGDIDTLVQHIQDRGATPIVATHAMRFGTELSGEERDLLTAWRSFTPRATEVALLNFERAAATATSALATSRGIGVVDLAGSLTGRSELFADFTHFTAEGSGVVAGMLAREVHRALTGQRRPVAH